MARQLRLVVLALVLTAVATTAAPHGDRTGGGDRGYHPATTNVTVLEPPPVPLRRPDNTTSSDNSAPPRPIRNVSLHARLSGNGSASNLTAPHDLPRPRGDNHPAPRGFGAMQARNGGDARGGHPRNDTTRAGNTTSVGFIARNSTHNFTRGDQFNRTGTSNESHPARDFHGPRAEANSQQHDPRREANVTLRAANRTNANSTAPRGDNHPAPRGFGAMQARNGGDARGGHPRNGTRADAGTNTSDRIARNSTRNFTRGEEFNHTAHKNETFGDLSGRREEANFQGHEPRHNVTLNTNSTHSHPRLAGEANATRPESTSHANQHNATANDTNHAGNSVARVRVAPH